MRSRIDPGSGRAGGQGGSRAASTPAGSSTCLRVAARRISLAGRGLPAPRRWEVQAWTRGRRPAASTYGGQDPRWRSWLHANALLAPWSRRQTAWRSCSTGSSRLPASVWCLRTGGRRSSPSRCCRAALRASRARLRRLGPARPWPPGLCGSRTSSRRRATRSSCTSPPGLSSSRTRTTCRRSRTWRARWRGRTATRTSAACASRPWPSPSGRDHP